MTTEQIIWTVVIVAAALALIGFIVATMRKRTQEQHRAHAAEIRQQADTKAAVIPDAQARADEAEAQAAQARLQAERAEQQAQEARGAAAQHEALHEDQVRAADRLDPDVNHKARDYTPDTAAVAGSHAGDRTEHEAADPHPSGASSGNHAGERADAVHHDERATEDDPETILDGRDAETGSTDTRSTDTSTRDTSATDGSSTDTRTFDPTPSTDTSSTDTGSTDTGSSDTGSSDTTSETTTAASGKRVDEDAAQEPDWTDPDQRDGTAGGPAGGSHRA